MMGPGNRIVLRAMRDQALFWMFALVFFCLGPWAVSLIPISDFPLVYILDWFFVLVLFLLFPFGRHTKSSAIVVLAMALTVRLLWATYTDTLNDSLMSVFADLAVVALLIRYLGVRRLDHRWALFYALNPLVLITNLHGHWGGWVGLCLIAAVYAHRLKYWGRMFFSLGCAGVLCPWILVGIPFFLNRKTVGWLIVGLIPLIFSQVSLLYEVRHFPMQFMAYPYPGPAKGVMKSMVDGVGLADWIYMSALAVMVLSGLVVFRPGGPLNRDDDPGPGLIWVLGSVFLFSPNVIPEPVCWVLPLALIHRKLSWLLLTLAVGVTGSGTVSQGGLILAWAPFCCAVFMDVRMGLIRCSSSRLPEPPQHVSVVIPVINEEAKIADCVTRIRGDASVCEVIVVDGGSRDRTIGYAEEAGARVVNHGVPPDRGGGRGGQIRRGIESARGDVIAIVHADTRVEKGAFTFLIDVLQKNPRLVGGSLGCVFDGSSLRLKVIDVLNTVRAALFFISFGDQIQYFRREPVVERHLFPAIPLMEDVEISLRLLHLGQTAHHFSESRVSPRRWNAHGMSNFGIVLWLFASYLIQRLWKTPDTLGLYRRYYRQ